MKLLSELAQVIKEMDELSCEYCGKELETKEEFETGECAKCAQERFQSERGSQFDGAREEDSEYVECYVDEDDNILSEAAVRMFKRFGKEIKRRYRCTTGPKKGKPVSDPTKCATRKDPKKVRHGRKVARTKKGIRIRKSKIALRTSMSRMVRRMNARLKGGKNTSNKPKTASAVMPPTPKPKKIFTKSSSTMKPVKTKSAKKTK